MKRIVWLLLHSFMFMFVVMPSSFENIVVRVEGNVEEKAEATIPITIIMSPPPPPPPEGNTTFLYGPTWCVAQYGASQADLKIALDWACGPGKADCGPIQPDRQCFEPNTLVHHASYAFNNYFQQNGNNYMACYFGGTATLTKIDPSYGRCAFDASESEKSSALDPLPNHKTWRNPAITLALLFLTKQFRI